MSPPSNWVKVKFEEIAQNITDRIDKPSESGLKDYIGLDQIDTDQLRIKRFASTLDVEATKFLCKKGDIIFGKRNAYLRKVAVSDRDAVVSAHSMVLRPFGDLIDSDFLPCFLQSSTFWKVAFSVSEGSMSPTIKWKILAKQEFMIPLLAEQKKISKLLWAIENNIEKTENLIAINQKMKKGLLNELFTKGIGHSKFKKTEIGEIPEEWNLVELKDVTLEKGGIKRGPWGSSIKKEYFVPSGYKIYEQGNVINNDFQRGNYYLDERKYKELESCSVRPHDILITGSGTIGKIAVVPEEIEPGVFNQALLRIRLNKRISETYFINLMNYYFESDFLDSISQGGIQKNFASVKILEKIPVGLPTLNEQEKIIGIINSFEDSINSAILNMNSLNNLKKKLTDEILKGNIKI